MKRGHRKTKGVVKGAPSGIMISLLVHAVAFMLAGLLVIFTVHEKKEKKFVPPKPVDRPKMKLKKPKVKVKKSAKPKSTQRIVTKVKRASMPDIQLPEMSGIGDGIGDEIGGFEIMPDLSEVTIFGAGQTIGNDFEGTFYDFKRTRNGRPVTMSDAQFVDEMIKFTSKGWRPSSIAKFYRSPKKLYATSFMLPTLRSSMAPSAFDEADTIGYAWMVHYKGQLVHHEDIKFRFWAHGDDILVVRVDGEVVVNACWEDNDRGTRLIGGNWVSSATKNRQFYMGNNLAWGGDWIELEAGVPKDMEVILGEVPGGGFCSMLTVEVEGETYEKNKQNQPTFPMFKTAASTHDLIDAITEHLVPGEASITNGPIFQDYRSSGRTVVEQEPEAVMPEPQEESSLRMWNFSDGKSVEAEFVTTMGDKIVLRTAKGKQSKVPVERFSEEDLKFIKLSNPPKFSVGFVRSSKNIQVEMSPYNNSLPHRVLQYVFGAKVKQTSAGDYNCNLTLEYYAIGQQFLDGNKYKLLDRQSSSFVLTRESGRSFELKGDRTIELLDYNLDQQRRGIRSAESLVLLIDERGEIIAHSATAKWLYEHVENLKKLQIGNFLDKKCERVYPTGPKATNY